MNRYRYPDGYQRRASRGEEVLTPREWRRNYVADIFARFDTGVAPVLPGPARRRGAR